MIPKRQMLLLAAAISGLLIIIQIFWVMAGGDPRFAMLPFSMSNSLTKFSGASHVYPNFIEDLSYLDSVLDMARQNGLGSHPVINLISAASQAFRRHAANQSTTLKEAAQKYKEKYRLCPPPRFDDWYAFARTHGVLNIDDFDQIMDDLSPFWSISPSDLRATVRSLEGQDGIDMVMVRSGRVVELEEYPSWRSSVFRSMVKPIARYLPDLDIPLNIHDQPRVAVDFSSLTAEMEAYRFQSKSSFVSRSIDFSNATVYSGPEIKLPERSWERLGGMNTLSHLSKSCPPESFAQQGNATSEEIESAYCALDGMFVSNYNESSDICMVGPLLEHAHGTLVAPSTLTLSSSLVPIFSECKLNVNNDILFPADMYYIDKDDVRYAYNGTLDKDWKDKKSIALWRGITSGGIQAEETWRDMHRHRFVLETNSSLLEHDLKPLLVPNDSNEGYTREFKNVSELMRQHSDVGFSELAWCVPDDEKCEMLSSFFEVKDSVDMSHQFEYKYLFDIDGHSFSGRFRAMLQSGSLPIKATLFREWQDERLFPWLHFIPMDNDFHDVYSILDFFAGSTSLALNEQNNNNNNKENDDGEAQAQRDLDIRDQIAAALAASSRKWANSVLRKTDMEVYMLRLLLEYARLMDDNRKHVGYVSPS